MSEIAVLSVLVVAVATDVRTGKIRNWLTLPAAALGPVLHLLEGGSHQALLSLAGLGGMVLVAAVLVSFRVVGGGDVKLLVAVGSLVGWRQVDDVLLFTALAGGLLAIVALAIQRRTAAVVGQMAQAAWLRVGLRVSCTTAAPSRIKLPYSLPIAVGTVLALVLGP